MEFSKKGITEILKEQYDQMGGQFVLYDTYHVGRFIGIVDGKDDYYYVMYDGRRITYDSCVGTIYQLKGKIEEDAYNEMIRIAKLNHHDYLYPNPDEYRQHLLKQVNDIVLFGIKWEDDE